MHLNHYCFQICPFLKTLFINVNMSMMWTKVQYIDLLKVLFKGLKVTISSTDLPLRKLSTIKEYLFELAITLTCNCIFYDDLESKAC